MTNLTTEREIIERVFSEMAEQPSKRRNLAFPKLVRRSDEPAARAATQPRLPVKMYGGDLPSLDFHRIGPQAHMVGYERLDERMHAIHVSSRVSAQTASLAQLRRNEELYAAAASADYEAVDLLVAISEVPVITSDELSKLVTSTDKVIALGKLFRANYIRELDGGITATALGKEELARWRSLLVKNR
jgi:hypothetical protein